MENKYFTPSIEDIRVGYECEIKPRGSDLIDWMPYIINENHAFHNYFLEGRGSTAIRVPYLTKEQIEAEGWEETTKFNYRKNRDITCFYENGLLVIYRKVRCIFDGKCKDINTFRYVVKLLNIK